MKASNTSVKLNTTSLFFFFSLIYLTGFTQSYTPIPSQNMRWKMWSTNTEAHWNNYEYETWGDTLINGLTYTKLHEKSVKYTWHNNGMDVTDYTYTEGYVGSFRNDSLNKKVYFFDPMWSAEELLYDFNLGVGDTLKLPFFYGQLKPILALDTVMIDGTNRIRYLIDSCSLGQMKFYVIEGIGSTYGMKAYAECPFENSDDLNCVSLNGNVIYTGIGGDTSCSVITSVKNLSQSKKVVKAFPNPANQSITFVLDVQSNQVYNLEIIDITGRTMISTEEYFSGDELTISQLTNGVFFYILTNQQTGKVSLGRFVKL